MRTGLAWRSRSCLSREVRKKAAVFCIMSLVHGSGRSLAIKSNLRLADSSIEIGPPSMCGGKNFEEGNVTVCGIQEAGIQRPRNNDRSSTFNVQHLHDNSRTSACCRSCRRRTQQRGRWTTPRPRVSSSHPPSRSHRYVHRSFLSLRPYPHSRARLFLRVIRPRRLPARQPAPIHCPYRLLILLETRADQFSICDEQQLTCVLDLASPNLAHVRP